MLYTTSNPHDLGVENIQNVDVPIVEGDGITLFASDDCYYDPTFVSTRAYIYEGLEAAAEFGIEDVGIESIEINDQPVLRNDEAKSD